MIVIDTSVIVAYMNSRDSHHRAACTWLDAADDDLTTTPMVAAEVDHLVSTRGGSRAVSAWRADLRSGAYYLDWWPAATGAAIRAAERYGDIGLGLTDASLIVLAERLHTIDVATFDEGHFRAVRPLVGGAAFRLLPADL